MRIVALGILAHNEENDIGALINDIAQQTILENPLFSIHLHVVANGCTDQTIPVTQHEFARAAFHRPNVRTFVHNIPEAGKSNAWNKLIHELCSPTTEFIILLDADIRIPETFTLERMLSALINSAPAVVAIDESVKDLSLSPNLTLVERLILSASGTSNDTRKALAGGCYCARFGALRSVTMPTGLPGEDGFLRAMLLTSNFTTPEDVNRLVYVEGARHIFESQRSIKAVFRHNVRLAIGTAINIFLFLHFRRAPRSATDLALYIQEKNAVDPKWVNSLILERMEKCGYFIVPTSLIWKRPIQLRRLPMKDRFKRAPIFVLGFLFDLAVYLRANHLMRKGAGAGYW